MKIRALVFRIGAAAVLLMGAATAWAYPIDVTSDLGGMDLKLTSIDDPSAAIVGIQSADSRTAKCTVEFTNGPDLPARRTATIAPGKSQTLSFPIKRFVIKAAVNVSCVPAAPKDAPKK